MTSISDVHLFAWLKENATIVGGALVVMWALIVYFYKTATAKYLTRHEGELIIKAKIAELRILIDKDNDAFDKTQGRILDSIRDIEVKIDIQSVENNKAHQSLLASVLRKSDP